MQLDFGAEVAVLDLRSDLKTIYVRLLNEDIDVWRPVLAEQISSNQYVISSELLFQMERCGSIGPGSNVIVEMREFKAISLVN